MNGWSRPKNLVEKHSCIVQMFTTKTIMKFTVERVIFLVLVFATVIDAHVPKNRRAEPKPRNSKTKNSTRLDAVKKSKPTKRDLEEVLSNEPINNDKIARRNNNEPIDLSELLNEKLKALIGKDDATKLEFIKNIKEVLGVNSYENKENDAIEALRGGDNADYVMENSMGRGSNIIGNLETQGFAGQGLPNRLPLLPTHTTTAHFYRTAALRRGLLNHRRFNRFFVNKSQSYPRTILRDVVVQIQPNQAKLHNPKQKIQATIQQKQPSVQQFQVIQPLQLQPMPSMPLQRLETETVLLMNMNHHEIHKPVFDSNDNAYPYEPNRKR